MKESPSTTLKSAKIHTPADAIDAQLTRYRAMRDFKVTAEPSGGKAPSPAGLPFCIQKHAATRLHYDFRLGWNGVLKSWACAKGPSYNVKDKRLAVQVEDHPMEYGGFEGIIPAGQYGGGTVMLWDQGTWEPQPGHPVEDGLRDGNLKFILHGTKMQGKWALIRMSGKAATESKPNWLLIKEHDDFERPPEAPAITDEAPRSVVTGRDLDQIAQSEDHVWNSKETQKGPQAWYRQDSKSTPAQNDKPKTLAPSNALASRSPKPPAIDIAALPKEPQPTFLTPQLAQQAETAPDGPGWLHELKLDGYRIQARKSGGEVKMLTRSGLDWTARIPAVAAAVAALPTPTLTLDGEVVVLAPDGTTNFADLQASFQEGARNPLTFFVFDLLHIEGRSPRDLPLIERKSLLAQVLAPADQLHLRLSEHLDTGGQLLFQKACELHAEGIVSKRAAGTYVAGRASDWLKMKCLHEQEFVIGGFTLPSNGSAGIGALLLGYYAEGKLIYAGRTGTGFTQKSSKLIRTQLEGLRTDSIPFERPPAEARRGALWVTPTLVAQVRFATWTAESQVRQAAFLGLREDKPATEVVRETSAPTPKRAKGSPLPTPGSSAAESAPEAPAKLAKSRAAKAQPAKPEPAKPLEKAPVRLTHPEKILDPASGVTKQLLADYLWAAAPRILPHIANRPLSLVRCPAGVGGETFFQKHVSKMLPKGIGGVDVPNKKTGVLEPYITLDNAEALASLAQMSVLEIHPWGSRNDNLEHADRLVIDLDPDESLTWPTVTAAAFEVRAFLQNLGLESFVKTTGGKGLHVVFAIEPTLDWQTTKDFAHALVNALERQNPRLYLTKMTKAARTGRIYLDYLRNERGATAVAPFSTRARPGVGVAVTLDWSELTGETRPTFPLAGFPDWGGRLNSPDPWKLLGVKQQTVTLDTLTAVAMKPR